MQPFIPSVLSALVALLKGPAWLVRKVISIFLGRRESPPPPIQPAASYSLSDSPYVESPHSQHQRSYEHTHSQQQRPTSNQSYPPPRPTAEKSESPHSHHQRSHERTQPQQQRSYHPYPPPRPTAEHSESAHSQHQISHERTQPQQQRSYLPLSPTAEHIESAHSQQQISTDFPYPQPRPVANYSQPPSQYTPSQPPSHHQLNVRFPAQPPTPVSPDVAPVAEPVQSRIPQRPRRVSASQLPSHRRPSVRFPAQPPPPVFPDVAQVAEPVQSRIPPRSRRVSGPELSTRAPEIVVTPVVIDPDEDFGALRLRARNEGNCMEECFDQSREAFARNERGLAKRLSLRGEAYKENMLRLDKEASMKIFQEHNQIHAGSNTIDLHGLFVPEAKQYFDDAVRGARDRGESLLYVIVGRGNGSENNIARIKPAIQEYGTSFGLSVEVDPVNDGRLVVSLNDS